MWEAKFRMHLSLRFSVMLAEEKGGLDTLVGQIVSLSPTEKAPETLGPEGDHQAFATTKKHLTWLLP